MTTTHFRLLEEHARIDDALRRELKRRVPDPVLTTKLKKLKLAIKDRLAAQFRRRGA